MAGLVTARLLNDTGFSVVVLEARKRLGGRIWTDNTIGVPCDLGASWIHGAKNNPLTAWCRSLGIDLVVSPKRSTFFYEGHRCRRFRELAWRARRAITGAGLAIIKSYGALRLKKMLGYRVDMSVEEAMKPLLTNPDIDASDRHVLSWLLAMVEAVHGAPADQLSLLEMDPQDFWATSVVPVSGYEQLIRDAASGLDIQLGIEVKKIAYGSHGVTALTGEGTFAADLVVVSVPLGVFQSGSLQFEPPLSLEKQTAIGRIGYGSGAVLNKIALRFPSRFWPEHCERLAVLPGSAERRGACTIWTDLQSLAGVPVLVGYTSGAIAAHWDQYVSDEELCEEALRVLGRMFSPQIPEPEAYRITRWLSDPWSRGAYSYGKVGSDPGDRKCLTEPISHCVFFTGEATHETRYGTTDGALLAGEREARRIHNHYCCSCEALEHLPWRKTT